MIQYASPVCLVAAGGVLLGRGARVAQRTLDPFILVRIRAPQPVKFTQVLFVSDEETSLYLRMDLTFNGPRAPLVDCVGARCFYL